MASHRACTSHIDISLTGISQSVGCFRITWSAARRQFHIGTAGTGRAFTELMRHNSWHPELLAQDALCALASQAGIGKGH